MAVPAVTAEDAVYRLGSHKMLRLNPASNREDTPQGGVTVSYQKALQRHLTDREQIAGSHRDGGPYTGDSLLEVLFPACGPDSHCFPGRISCEEKAAESSNNQDFMRASKDLIENAWFLFCLNQLTNDGWILHLRHND